MAAFPSITGSEASGPMSPSPSTAVPLLTMQIFCPSAVYSQAVSGLLAISSQTLATPGV